MNDVKYYIGWLKGFGHTLKIFAADDWSYMPQDVVEEYNDIVNKLENLLKYGYYPYYPRYPYITWTNGNDNKTGFKPNYIWTTPTITSDTNSATINCEGCKNDSC